MNNSELIQILEAVGATDRDGIDCEDVVGMSWFDARDKAIAALSGKKLVDAGAVVLSRATADWMLKHLQEGLTSYAREHLGEAIDRAENAGEVTK